MKSKNVYLVVAHSADMREDTDIMSLPSYSRKNAERVRQNCITSELNSLEWEYKTKVVKHGKALAVYANDTLATVYHIVKIKRIKGVL